MAKVVKYEGANGSQIDVPDSDLIIGRGFLKSDDKRVSRNHGLIRNEIVSEETFVYLKALHPTNPIFYRKKDGARDSVLQKNESILLVTEDKFRLTPDGDWFVVVDKEERRLVEAGEANTEEMSDLGGATNSTSHNVHESTSTNEEMPMKRRLECADSTDPGNKRNRLMDNDAVPSTSSETTISPPISIKPDPDCNVSQSTTGISTDIIKPDPDTASLQSTSATTMNIKPDPDGLGNAQVASGIAIRSPADTGTNRPSCDFGIRCYRGGNDHRAAFAHPGDNDYRRPSFPPAPPDAPFCPFGARCYRRNPVHFQEFQHLDPSAAMLNRPRRRIAFLADPNYYHDNGSDDEFDYPDFDGTSSDEFNPGMYDEDDNDTESEDEGLGCNDSDYQE